MSSIQESQQCTLCWTQIEITTSAIVRSDQNIYLLLNEFFTFFLTFLTISHDKSQSENSSKSHQAAVIEQKGAAPFASSAKQSKNEDTPNSNTGSNPVNKTTP